jgi:hypothetical protein
MFSQVEKIASPIDHEKYVSYLFTKKMHLSYLKALGKKTKAIIYRRKIRIIHDNICSWAIVKILFFFITQKRRIFALRKTREFVK